LFIATSTKVDGNFSFDQHVNRALVLPSGACNIADRVPRPLVQFTVQQ
jgi:hypothetical protein